VALGVTTVRSGAKRADRRVRVGVVFYHAENAVTWEHWGFSPDDGGQ